MFADIASEMLYPIVPVYLKEIGFSVLLIGILEGLAAFTAGISKGFFGKWSDETGRRLPFIKTGYLLSAISKPMMAAFAIPVWIFFARTTDRLGKGVRTAARDALLSQNATPATKAGVFGFHRSMDTFGAALGPILALILLWIYPRQYQLIFVLAFIPGIFSVLLAFFIKEKHSPVSTLGKGNFFSFFRYWTIAGKDYKKILAGLVFFAFFNSSDIFLLLKTREITGSDTITIAAYICYNLVFALSSWPLGRLADKVGMKKVFLGGILLFSVVYLVFSFTNSITVIFGAFVVYGLYAAATEGISKAWITNFSHKENTGTAIGFFTSCESIAAFVASALAGLIWTTWNSSVVFLVSATAAIITFLFFLFYIKGKNPVQQG
jgi:MFS family permease